MKKEIPAFKLIMQPLSEEAANMPKFKWAEEGVGERHQIGGTPTFIQKQDIPHCKECNEEMTFYAQLDSLNDEYCIGDVGMIYVFVCFDCLETTSIIQSY